MFGIPKLTYNNILICHKTKLHQYVQRYVETFLTEDLTKKTPKKVMSPYLEGIVQHFGYYVRSYNILI